MDTGALKSFGAWARTALIREVDARVAAVLAPASPERVEQPKGVAALEKAIGAAGGAGVGRAAVVDRVAYTWFNRLIALRFMDANGYTGIGVVSPRSDSASVGQPEILAEAKRGVIDSDVVGSAAGEAVSGLLNETRRSVEPQAEAYGLLLAEYCRYWNRFMPFMFERAGDFTELLMPANLLADDSVLNRAVQVLTKDVCQDVEVIGWLYQFYIAERKDEVFAGFKKNKKAGAEEIPAATQLFTPHWIVCYLLENSLGRLWMLNHPNSRLIDQMEYYLPPVDGESDFLKIDSPKELKVIDPACGSGHMLTYAFDLLYGIYEEQGYSPSEIPRLILENNLYGVEIDPRAGALAAFALTMKARARQRTFFSKRTDPNILTLEPISFTPQELDLLLTPNGDRDEESTFWNQFEHASTLGSLVKTDPELFSKLNFHIDRLGEGSDLFRVDMLTRAKDVVKQAGYLLPRYSVVTANPPYMRGRNMDALLSDFVRSQYPDSSADLFAVFIERCLSLALPHGRVAMITMQSWMFLSTFEDLRVKIVSNSALRTLAHLGAGAFEAIAGEVVTTCAFVLQATADRATPSRFIKLNDLPDEEAKRLILREIASGAATSAVFLFSGGQASRLPGWTFSYWMNDDLIAAFADGLRLADVAEPRVGLQTGDNGRFLRIWTEVSLSRIGFGILDRAEAQKSGRKWFPYNKGGSFRRWYGNQEHVVNWQDDGREIRAMVPKAVIRSPNKFFLPAASWSKVGTAEPAFRFFPAGFMFDVAGTSIFAEPHRRLLTLLAFSNSVVAREMLRAAESSMNLEVGAISELRIREAESETTEKLAERLIQIYSDDWDVDERSWNFQRLPCLEFAAMSVKHAIAEVIEQGMSNVEIACSLEEEVNRHFIDVYGLAQVLDPTVQIQSVAMNSNYLGRYGSLDPASAKKAATSSAVKDLVSYGVGCMFGRYSLDEPGLVLADQQGALQDYLARVPAPSFMPDRDNVIPIVDGDWFEDDIVERFRRFLRTAFGEDRFEENLRFVTDSLGVNDLRAYFLKAFYKDHVQRYKKRPIYWLFSSPKGSFNALIYMHRYNSSTVSTVLNEYLREFKAKLQSSLQIQDRLAVGEGSARQQAAALKEADRLRKMLLELNEYEDQVLYPLALQQIEIDLDDGVKVNFAKFGSGLKKIAGLEAVE